MRTFKFNRTQCNRNEKNLRKKSEKNIKIVFSKVKEIRKTIKILKKRKTLDTVKRK